jgi:DNA gyrase/topoisomerase IV subunit A
MDIQKSLTFIILNPENNPTALRNTTKTISDYYSKCKTLCVLGTKLELEENQKYAEVVQGGNTMTSLIDKGVSHIKTDWGFVIIAGTRIKPNNLHKYEYFCRDNKDILYPVVERKFAFDEASINGILMHRQTIKDVGLFGDNNHSIKLVKLLWALTAIEKGYHFKAIVGGRLV